jgi:hypothetical protein
MADARARLGRLIKLMCITRCPFITDGRRSISRFDWTTYGTLQVPRREPQAQPGLARKPPRAKPLYTQETLWAGNKFRRGATMSICEERLRAHHVSPAINFGDMNGDSSSGFSGTLEMNDLVQQRHDILKRVWDYFDTLPFWRLKPRQDLVSNGFAWPRKVRCISSI